MSGPDHDKWMLRAVELARQGEGRVEPNPMVGCVIVKDGIVVGEGWHQEFGGPHAEILALRQAGAQSSGATIYVTLEPCSHHGKTPPCSEAVIAANPRAVVVGQIDPNPSVAGSGIKSIQQKNITIVPNVRHDETAQLIQPFTKLMTHSRPWIIAKWAMTLDGKIATSTGDSKWISNEPSRQIVHQIRGRVDAILVGIGTALADDPQLTARPAGPRTATRIVLDSKARLPLDSHLVKTATQVPVLVWASPFAPQDKLDALRSQGCEVHVCEADSPMHSFDELTAELGKRRFTNILVEGGSQLLGTLFDARAIDEVHAFIAPKLAGGQDSVTPIAGVGASLIADSIELSVPVIQTVGENVYVRGRIHHGS